MLRCGVRVSRGFTLIELSIVLVIISLIVGGIIGGKSLIESAEINRVITKTNEYKLAWNNFILQYDAMPGDFNQGYEMFAGGSSTVCGNDDTSYNGCNGNGSNLYDIGQEGVRAFYHLKLAELINDNLSPYASSIYRFPYTFSALDNVPQMDINNGGGWIFDAYADEHAEPGWYGRTGNWLQFGAETLESGGGWWHLDGAVLTQRQASSIDKKLDDGMPATGNVTATDGSEASNLNTYPSPGCVAGSTLRYWRKDTPDTSVTYDVSGNNVACTLLFYLGR